MKETDRALKKAIFMGVQFLQRGTIESNQLSDNTVTGRRKHRALDKYKCVSVNEGVSVYVSFSASTTLLND